MRRIRRKQRYTWMPILGGLYGSGDTQYSTTFFGATVATSDPALGANDIYVTALVPDYTQWPTANQLTGETLRDFTEGQDWLLKRIVGNLYVGPNLETAAGVPPFFVVGAGFCVARADDANPNVPDASSDELDPLNAQNTRQPWIWRRTWFLENGLSPVAPTPRPLALAANQDVTGVIGGSTIDSKVARRIRREERLWFVLNGYSGSDTAMGQDGVTQDGHISFHLDYRILGAMRRSTNKSTF